MVMRIAGERSESEVRSTQALNMLPPRLLCIALVIALVSTLISLGARAAEGCTSGRVVAERNPQAASDSNASPVQGGPGGGF